MALMEWKDEYSVSVSGFDSQHKKLINLINDLHSAMSNGKGKDILGKTLDELVSYTVFHFASEEKMMKEHNYSGYSIHKIEHEKLTKQVIEFQGNLKSGEYVIPHEVLLFLKNWLVNHIMGTDKKYSGFFNSKGVL
jgi:hemerythrin